MAEIATRVRLGELLVELGALSPEHVDHILKVQKQVGRPFGDLAERLYGVHPRTVERAWARQYANLSANVDPGLIDIDPEVVRLLNRRQAWQFKLISASRVEGELQLVTDEKHLPRAMAFASMTFAEPVYFVVVDSATLIEKLKAHYPAPQHMIDYAMELN